MRYTELAESTRRHHHQPAPHFDGQGVSYPRQSFHHSHTSLGAAGHLLHMGMVAAPLVIGEVVHDSDKRWRAMRIVPVIGALASEALWTLKISRDRKREEADHAALESCHERCR